MFIIGQTVKHETPDVCYVFVIDKIIVHNGVKLYFEKDSDISYKECKLKSITEIGENMDDVIVIIKYSNRKLYSPEISSYITLSDLITYINDGKKIKIINYVTKKKITNKVLLEIIFKNEQLSSEAIDTNNLLHIIKDKILIFNPKIKL